MRVSTKTLTDLESEGQHNVRLGQDVSLFTQVQEGVVQSGAFQLLFKVRTALGHRQTLEVCHEQVDRRAELLYEESLHVRRDKLGLFLLLEDGGRRV